MMPNKDCADEALANMDLMQRSVVEHKTLFYKRSWLRYDLAVPRSFRLVPVKTNVQELEKDYQLMKPMIFGDIPTFQKIIDGLAALEQKTNSL